jgi:hypothetical protein
MSRPEYPKVRIPRRVADSILESDAATKPGTDPLADSLIGLLRATTARKDGSRVVTVDEDQSAVLWEYASTLADIAASTGDFSDLPDVNSAKAVLRVLPVPSNVIDAHKAADAKEAERLAKHRAGQA